MSKCTPSASLFACLALLILCMPASAQMSGNIRDSTHAARVIISSGGGRTVHGGGTYSQFTMGSPVAGRTYYAPRTALTGITAFLLGMRDTEPPAPFSLLTPADLTDTIETTIVFSWQLSSDSSPPISYRLIVDTNMVAPYVVDSSVVNLGTITASVLANDTYSWRVVASDVRSNSRTVGDSLIRVYTINPPVLTAPINGETSALSSRLFTWNAATTTGRFPLQDYRLQIAKDTSANLDTPIVDIIQSYPATETRPAYLFTDVATYYWRMLCRDTAGRTSVWTAPAVFAKSAPSETTAPLPPENFKVTSLDTGAILATWDKSLSIDAVQYNLYWDSGLGTSADTILKVIVSTGETYTYATPILVHGREYRFRIAASDSQGNLSSFVSAIATARTTAQTVANAVITDPRVGARFRHGDSSVPILVKLVGTSDQLTLADQLTFHYRTSPSGAWTAMTANASTADNANPISVTTAKTDAGDYRFVWNPSALAADTYDIRCYVTAKNGDSSLLVAEAISVRLVNAATESPTIINNVVEGGVEYQRVINANRPETFNVINPGDTQSVVVYVPPQAFTNASDTANVYMIVAVKTTSDYDSQISSATDAPAGDAVIIKLSNGDTTLANGKQARLRITFRDIDQNGFIDGSRVRWNRVWVERHPGTADGSWEKLVTSSSSDPTATAAGWIEVYTSRFSVFRLVGAAAEANLNSFAVGPNPYRPNDGNPATGLPYTGAAGTGIYFTGLPMQVKIEIYTVTGRKVMEFQTANSTGQIQWDARNNAGRDVASGVYIYRVQDLVSGQSTSGKLTVIR